MQIPVAPIRAQEDSLILELVGKHGPRQWSLIASHLKGRIGKQCRERFGMSILSSQPAQFCLPDGTTICTRTSKRRRGRRLRRRSSARRTSVSATSGPRLPSCCPAGAP